MNAGDVRKLVQEFPDLAAQLLERAQLQRDQIVAELVDVLVRIGRLPLLPEGWTWHRSFVGKRWYAVNCDDVCCAWDSDAKQYVAFDADCEEVRAPAIVLLAVQTANEVPS